MSRITNYHEVSRRRVLSAVGGAVAGNTLTTQATSEQPQVMRQAMIPPTNDFVTEDYDSYFIHIGEWTSRSPSPAVPRRRRRKLEGAGEQNETDKGGEQPACIDRLLDAWTTGTASFPCETTHP